ncbi:MAG: hypothetical protein J6N21_16035 [Butyrivibrio sp.]|nr:hypothetical protein [Butyrivibrio sp.]
MKKLKELCTENLVAIAMLLFTVLFPIFNSAYKVDQFTGFYITCFLTFSIVLIWGYTGIFSFGQAAFYGIGAYTYAIISLCSDKNLTIVAALAGTLIAGIAATLLGYFIFYGGVDEIFTGIITLCVSIILETFIVQTSGPEYKILGVWIGGYNGLNSIPKLQIGDFYLTDISLYFFVAAIVFAIYLAFRYMTHSNIGYALFGIRESKTRSELFGFKTAKLQTLTFGVSGAIAGLGGVLFSAWSGYVVPSTLSVGNSTIAVVMVALAGRKNITGALIMTVIYSFITQKLAASGNVFSDVILGIGLVLIVMFMPDGLLEELFKKVDFFFKERTAKA